MTKPRFNAEDMSVKETEFVNNEFQVEPAVYCRIKDHVFNEILTKAKDEGVKEARSQARAQLREEVKKELLEELMPQYKAVATREGEAAALEKARRELEPKIRQEMLADSRKEFDSQWLTDEDKKAYSIGLREVEVESLTFATSASAEADGVQSGSSIMSKARHAGLAASLLGIGPFAVWLLSTKDWHTVPFWLTALPYIVLLGYCLFWRPKSVTDAESLRSISSEYLQLVSRSRIARMVQIDTQSRREVQAEMQAILNAKSRLDEKYKPSVNRIEEVKPQVKMRLAEEIDPEKLFAEEFEERLNPEGKKAG